MDLSLTPESLQNVVGKFIILLLSIAVHEFGHAFIADRLGDRLPRQQGRVTLNPLAHADLIGTVALPLFSLISSGGTSTGFGWGKPVMTSGGAAYTRRFRMRVSSMFVSLAGPMMNLVFGTFLAGVAVVLYKTDVFTIDQFLGRNTLASMLVAAVWTNYVLMFFNLLPARPLDGGAVLEGLLPDRALRSEWFAQYQRMSLFVAAAFIMVGTLGRVFTWPAEQLLNGVLHVFGLPISLG
jgi:Zn-dependent protease